MRDAAIAASEELETDLVGGHRGTKTATAISATTTSWGGC